MNDGQEADYAEAGLRQLGKDVAAIDNDQDSEEEELLRLSAKVYATTVEILKEHGLYSEEPTNTSSPHYVPRSHPIKIPQRKPDEIRLVGFHQRRFLATNPSSKTAGSNIPSPKPRKNSHKTTFPKQRSLNKFSSTPLSSLTDEEIAYADSVEVKDVGKYATSQPILFTPQQKQQEHERSESDEMQNSSGLFSLAPEIEKQMVDAEMTKDPIERAKKFKEIRQQICGQHSNKSTY